MTAPRPASHRALLRASVAAATALLGITVGMSSASASGAGATDVPFAAQAKQAGLNATQAKALQTRVNGYLAQTGGTQTAANEITYSPAAGGGTLTLTLPGEKKARSLNPTATLGGDCAYYWFCAFAESGYNGDSRKAEKCNTNTFIPWTTTNGSWINNQTAGTRAKFKNSGYGIIGYSAGAYAAQSYGVNWTSVYYIDPC
ncbi:hypothetical protein [Streptomyces sp. NPDC051183]|uniref:hypothetical protein n=1 Tax=Streptomyces sp. NPDC051183 TaxID=3155165 RepID=UPI0034190A9B